MANAYTAQTWTEDDVFTPTQATNMSEAVAEVTAPNGVDRTNLAKTVLQSGLINNSGNFVQGTTYTRTIPFGTAFAAPPDVVVTMGGTDPTVWAGPSVTEIGTTSFKVHYTRLGSSGSYTANLYWIATPRTQTNTF